MAHDDEKPDTGDDPWAGLEAGGTSELEGDFSFSFDDEPAPETAGGVPAEQTAGEPAATADTPELPLGDMSGAEADAGAWTDADAGSTADLFADALAAEGDQTDDVTARGAVEDAAIDDWLSDDAAASSVLSFDVSAQAAVEGGDSASIASAGSSVELGTGTSGILSPSGIEPADDSAPDGAASEEIDPFADLSAEEAAGVADEMFAFAAESAAVDEFAPDATPGSDDAEAPAADGSDAFAAVGATALAGQALAAGDGQPAKKGKRQPAPRRKQPSVIGQLAGVVFGGALAIPITLAILLWGLGKDPFGIAAKVPDSLSFLLPPALRPAARLGTDAIDLATAPSLDAVLGEAGTDAAASAGPPDAADLAGPDAAAEPEPAVEPEPLPDEPATSDLAAVTPAPGDGQAGSGEDPLMDLLAEGDADAPAVEPPPPPAPEPLDLTELDAAVADATAALEAAAAVDDPSDPVRRRLLAKWYRALAGYAERLVGLESLAIETGRPFEPATDRATAVRAGLAEHPRLLEELGVLSRDWIDYAKRPSDGVVMPATFVAARRAGPYWRSQVNLPATGKRPAVEMVVLTRTEPAVAPGDAVVVTGLAIDDDVVWAVDVRPAAVDASGFPGL